MREETNAKQLWMNCEIGLGSMPNERSMPEKCTLKYHDAFISEVASLPPMITEALYAFLERLASDPDSPELGADLSSRGFWACQFTSGYSVYWKVEREKTHYISLSSGQPKAIRLIKLKPLPESVRSARSRART